MSEVGCLTGDSQQHGNATLFFLRLTRRLNPSSPKAKTLSIAACTVQQSPFMEIVIKIQPPFRQVQAGTMGVRAVV